MKELMDLLTRLVIAVEGINHSLANASTAGPQVDMSPARGLRGYLDDRKAMDDRKVQDQAAKPAPTPDRPAPAQRRMSDTSDISVVSADVLESSRAAMVTFAIDNLKVPWSEAHMRSVMEYERKVDEEFGEGSSLKLPWRNVVPRGEEGLR